RPVRQVRGRQAQEGRSGSEASMSSVEARGEPRGDEPTGSTPPMRSSTKSIRRDVDELRTRVLAPVDWKTWAPFAFVVGSGGFGTLVAVVLWLFATFAPKTGVDEVKADVKATTSKMTELAEKVGKLADRQDTGFDAMQDGMNWLFEATSKVAEKSGVVLP